MPYLPRVLKNLACVAESASLHLQRASPSGLSPAIPRGRRAVTSRWDDLRGGFEGVTALPRWAVTSRSWREVSKQLAGEDIRRFLADVEFGARCRFTLPGQAEKGQWIGRDFKESEPV